MPDQVRRGRYRAPSPPRTTRCARERARRSSLVHTTTSIWRLRATCTRVEAGAAFLGTAHAMVHVLVELPPSGPAVRPELFHLRGRILIGGGDARVDPGGHEPRLVGRTRARSYGGRSPVSPFCLRLGCDLVCGHTPPHTGRGWKLRETTTKVVRLAGVEPATLGLEARYSACGLLPTMLPMRRYNGTSSGITPLGWTATNC